jgi:hypothetical protein
MLKAKTAIVKRAPMLLALALAVWIPAVSHDRVIAQGAPEKSKTYYEDDLKTVTITRWPEVDTTRRIDHAEWQAKVSLPGPLSVELIASVAPAKSSRQAGHICIIVNSDLVVPIQVSLDQYIDDLTDEGYTTEMHSWAGGTAEDLRTFLQNRHTAGIDGIVLIGDLPFAWFEMDVAGHEEFPCDLFLMDMDGIWGDGDGDGIYDNHSGDVTPEIWFGRLTASPLIYGGATEVGLLQNYFQKDHDYRTGQLVLNSRALVYIDDDWEGSASGWSNNVGLAYSNRTMVSDPDQTVADDYTDYFPRNYEAILVAVHSSPIDHYFKKPGVGWHSQVFYHDVVDADPVALFYNLFACSNARFVQDNYMAGWYIFCPTFGLGAVGSTKSGAMLNFHHFYEPFGSGYTIGESFANWFSAIGADGFSSDERLWHYGMTLCGDPTLLRHPTPTATYFVILVDRTNSMNGLFGGVGTRFDNAIIWATNDVDNIFDANPGARVAVMSFMTPFDDLDNPNIVLELGFSPDRDAVKTAISNIDPPDGRTPLARALSDAADLLKETDPDNVGVMYIYTDGGENESRHNSASPICGACDIHLASPPDILPAEWNELCDPAIAGTCSDYQTCMANQFVFHDIIHVRYFGHRVAKSGLAPDTEPTRIIAERDAPKGQETPDDNADGRTLAADFAWLRYVTETTGGQFIFQVDTNQAPVISYCPVDTTIHWGDLYIDSVVASDADGDTLTYTLVLPPDTFPEPPYGMSLDPHTGIITWQTTGGDICDHMIAVLVSDGHGSTDTCVFSVCVTNDRPAITCPPDTVRVYWGYAACGSVSAVDPDDGPGDLLFSVVSFNGFGGPASVIINPETGDWIWPTQEDLVYVGKFDLCIAVTDRANICDPCSPMNADTCCVPIRVKPRPAFAIEKTHNTLQGHYVDVSLTVEHTELDMGGFDFLIAYDASALAPTEVTPGQLLEDCEWEYFTYRFGVHGNCGDACPSGLLRIIAIAETNNGPYHPACYGPPELDYDIHELAVIRFFVTNDRTFDCEYVPIRFFWDDCNDNAISSIAGDTLYVDLKIYDFEGNLIWNEEDDDLFPEDARIPFVGAPDYCLIGDKVVPIRLPDFIDGGIDIICSDSIDVKGDINCNGIPFEIADAVMFTNYFIGGLGGFPYLECAISASDTNNDGIPLSIADLVYLIRVIVGDALPDPKAVATVNKVSVSAMINHSAAAVATNSSADIGAGYFVFNHSDLEVGEPQLINGATDMTLKYSDEDGVLKVLVYSMEKGVMIPAGTENIFAVPIAGQGEIEIVEVQLSDYYGNLLEVSIDKQATLPTKFALHQNYPNPFNATTTIIYELPEVSHVTIEIFNVLGQKVTTLTDGREDAGIHSVEWNGADETGSIVSSGVYFYRISTPGYSAEKKMVLMK